ncbi:MAG: hypothetical protein M0D55_10925 [Elusimicrobiota bacterium]|nr:MAG: hypothetical protein M0D55_10925 [Elusimicrobiota bacterium]
MERARTPEPGDDSLYARILSRLGPDEARESVAFLNQRLKDSPEDKDLRLTLGRAAYEDRDYAQAAASVRTIMDSPEATPLQREQATALWHLTKGRGAAVQSSAQMPSPAKTEVSSAEPTIVFSPQPRRAAGVPSGLSGTPDPAWIETAAARQLLQKSKLGNEVLQYALGEGVKFELTDLPSDMGAASDKDRNAILVPKDISARPPSPLPRR